MVVVYDLSDLSVAMSTAGPLSNAEKYRYITKYHLHPLIFCHKSLIFQQVLLQKRINSNQ